MTCKDRDQAQGPRYSSQPYGRLTLSTPELRAQLNLTNDHKKKGSPHLQECPDAFTWSHVMLKLLSSVPSWAVLKKRMLSRLPAMQGMVKIEKVIPSTAARSFNTHSTDRVKLERWTAVSLYFNELLIQKCQFRGNSLLRQAFPEGFMPPWRNQHESHTCSERSLRILMWNASDVQKTLQLNLTRRMKSNKIIYIYISYIYRNNHSRHWP